MLSALDPQKVCFLIVKIRAYDVQAQPNLGGGSDATDDKFVASETGCETNVSNLFFF